MKVRFKPWKGKKTLACWWAVESLHTAAARVYTTGKLQKEIATAHLNMKAMINYTKSD
jgi:hypothetical protein